jgi:hypothetical protein
MSEVLLPMVEEEWRKPPVLSAETLGSSLMTPIGLIEGDILTVLERDGATAMRRLIRELDWPAPMVFMAVGALIREGLLRAIRHDLEIVLGLEDPGGAGP